MNRRPLALGGVRRGAQGFGRRVVSGGTGCTDPPVRTHHDVVRW